MVYDEKSSYNKITVVSGYYATELKAIANKKVSGTATIKAL